LGRLGRRDLADEIASLLRRTCKLARALTDAEQSASDEENVRELAALIGETLEALRGGVHRALIAD
jgi:hypothetical protein